MQKFQDSDQRIEIVSESGQVFSCDSAAFADYEPTYQPVQPGHVRVWMPAVQYIAAEGNQRGDPFYTPGWFGLYLSNIATYQARYDTDNAPISPTFETEQAAALTAWNQHVNAFITQYFDTGTQISFVKLYIQSKTARPLIAQVDAWVMQVMAYYYQIKHEIQAATTLDGLHQLQSVMEFESLFGKQGGICAVPDVALSQFF